MKLTRVAVAAASLLACGVVFAQTAAPAAPAAPEPDYTLSANVGVVSDYRYRGLSQSRLGPAIQGGLDFAHKSGFYVGLWSSSIKWIKDAGGNASAEVDIYGGYKFNAGPIAWDLGVLRYQYPDSELTTAPNTTELYASGTYGPGTIKWSHSVTNLFGVPDSKNSDYLDLNATFDTGYWGLSLTPHVGHQWIAGNNSPSYTDWSLTLGKDFGNGISASAAYVDTNTSAYRSPDNKDLGRAALVVGVKYTYSF